MAKVRIVPASEISTRSLRAEDYVARKHEYVEGRKPDRCAYCGKERLYEAHEIGSVTR